MSIYRNTDFRSNSVNRWQQSEDIVCDRCGEAHDDERMTFCRDCEKSSPRSDHSELDTFSCEQCYKSFDDNMLTICGDCEKTLCNHCAAEWRCDLCYETVHQYQQAQLQDLDYLRLKGSGYSLCELCYVCCDSCAGVSLCQYCKPDHIRLCNPMMWGRRTIAFIDQYIEQKEREAEQVRFMMGFPSRVSGLAAELTELEANLDAARATRAEVEHEVTEAQRLATSLANSNQE